MDKKIIMRASTEQITEWIETPSLSVEIRFYMLNRLLENNEPKDLKWSKEYILAEIARTKQELEEVFKDSAIPVERCLEIVEWVDKYYWFELIDARLDPVIYIMIPEEDDVNLEFLWVTLKAQLALGAAVKEGKPSDGLSPEEATEFLQLLEDAED